MRISTSVRMTKVMDTVAVPSSGAYSGNDALTVIVPIPLESVLGTTTPLITSAKSSPVEIVKFARSSRIKFLEDPSS